ncbi:unnamed protein product [Pieris macdunnoughi]|uniref:POU domain protein n=1 Tax=Pieris macdunnoughi TaxID=345717 RepID=A0A821LBH7_9NEOP|nr:unnamed protein product [Pieris macdunnoughi]
MCNSWSPRHNGDIFSGLNDGLLSRAEALAAVDISKHQSGPQPGPPLPQLKHDMVYHHGVGGPPPHNTRPHQVNAFLYAPYLGKSFSLPISVTGEGWFLGEFRGEVGRALTFLDFNNIFISCGVGSTINQLQKPFFSQMGHHGMEGLDMLEPSATSMTTLAPMGEGAPPHHQLHGYGAMNHVMNHHHHTGGLAHAPPAHLVHPGAALHPDTDTDPRELEAFAERFKQRRIKLGVTQADVGKALANLKLPGVGALSQSTICRFESLTLSHNNMIALKPILQAWLEEAEAQAKNKRRDPDAPSVLPAGEKKRKRTSIAAPEKRSLEAYFAVQPRPSGEKIAAIAEKLDLKKNVVRVWFCNQRQKQKRMKFAAQH